MYRLVFLLCKNTFENLNEKLYELCLQNMLRFFKKSEEIMKFALPFQMETAYLSSEKKKTDHNHSYD